MTGAPDDFYAELAHQLAIPIPRRWIVDGTVIESDWRALTFPEVQHVLAMYRRTVNPIDRGRLDDCTYYVRPVDTAKAQRCRHCGDLIVPVGGALGWSHAHHLFRCQQPGRPYGYEARAPSPGPCECQACQRDGQTSPADNTSTGRG